MDLKATTMRYCSQAMVQYAFLAARAHVVDVVRVWGNRREWVSQPHAHGKQVMRPITFTLLLLAAAMSISSCSALLELEPDCEEKVDCGAYRCNEAGTACLSSCSVSADCAPGGWCDEERGTCEMPMCEAVSEALALEGLDERFEESALAVLASEEIAPQAVVMVSGDTGTGVVRYAAPDFSLLDTDGQEGFIVSRLAVSSRRPTQPSLVPLVDNPSSAQLVWLQTTASATLLQGAQLDAAEGQFSPTQTFINEDERVRVNALELAAGEPGVWATWQQTMAGRVVVMLRPLTADNDQEVEEMRLSSDDVDARFPSLIAEGNQVRALWLEPRGSAIWSVYSRLFDHEGSEEGGRVEVTRAVGPIPLEVTHRSDGERLYQIIEGGELQARDVAVNVLSPVTFTREASFDLDEHFSEISAVHAVAAEQGVLVMLSGTQAGSRGVWLVHVSAEGELVDVPLRVASVDPSLDLDRLHLAGVEDELWFMWTERDFETGRAQSYLRGFRCSAHRM